MPQKIVKALQFLVLAIIAGAFVFPFLYSHYFSTFFHKAVFSISMMLVTIMLWSTIKNALQGAKGILVDITGCFFFALPCLWVFEFITWYWTIAVMVLYVIVIGLLLNYLKKKKARTTIQ